MTTRRSAAHRLPWIAAMVIVFVALPDGRRFAFVGDLAWQREGITEREERPWLMRRSADDDPGQVRDNLLRMAAVAERFPQITLVPAHDLAGSPAYLASSTTSSSYVRGDMTHTRRNIELKSRCSDLDAVRRRAEVLGARDAGMLRQRDTFFTARHARLKLRDFGDGRAELISYVRPDTAEARGSDYVICPVAQPDQLAAVLTHASGRRGTRLDVRARRWG